jgi:hypothetical protein
MKFLKLSLITFTITAFLTGCNAIQPDPTSTYPTEGAGLAVDENGYWAKENLDLQAVGGLLEKADDAEEFEYLLNSEDGVNNLDMNGDGYADYISVREFDDREDNQRGFSLFSMFGPDLIQEIAQVIFYRDRNDYPGSRVLVRGNDQIYGDNYYYETNWLDRSVPIASWIFTDRDNYYRSPYYYDYYPDYYDVYEVVDTPVYVTRVKQYYYEPVFIRTAEPTYITQIKIKSPNYGRSIDKIYSKLAKPTKEQVEFRKNNPNKPEFVPVKKGNPNRAEFQPKGNPNKIEKGIPNGIEKPGKNNVERPVRLEKTERPAVKQQQPKSNPNTKQNNPSGKGGGKGGGKKP